MSEPVGRLHVDISAEVRAAERNVDHFIAKLNEGAKGAQAAARIIDQSGQSNARLAQTTERVAQAQAKFNDFQRKVAASVQQYGGAIAALDARLQSLTPGTAAYTLSLIHISEPTRPY